MKEVLCPENLIVQIQQYKRIKVNPSQKREVAEW